MSFPETFLCSNQIYTFSRHTSVKSHRISVVVTEIESRNPDFQSAFPALSTTASLELDGICLVISQEKITSNKGKISLLMHLKRQTPNPKADIAFQNTFGSVCKQMSTWGEKLISNATNSMSSMLHQLDDFPSWTTGPLSLSFTAQS